MQDEEKKLNDEEVIKAFETCDSRAGCYFCPLWDTIREGKHCGVLAIDIIRRLQAENEELKSPKFASWKIKFFNAQEEIKRLTEERDGARVATDNYLRKTLELQKQVDELTEERENMRVVILALEEYKCLLKSQLDKLTLEADRMKPDKVTEKELRSICNYNEYSCESCGARVFCHEEKDN